MKRLAVILLISLLAVGCGTAPSFPDVEVPQLIPDPHPMPAPDEPTLKECDFSVNRGFSDDGITTVEVVVPDHPVTNGGSLWNGWHEIVFRSFANNNGISYDFAVRYNHVNSAPTGSVTWMSGGASGAFFRDSRTLCYQAQDRAETNGVRSIDCKFMPPSGAKKFPRNGYVNISAVYADVLEWLWFNGVATGRIGHVGSSGGSIVGAAALVNHDLHKIMDFAIFGAGPFFVDFEQDCLGNTGAPKSEIDAWTYTEMGLGTPCQQRVQNPPISYACTQILGVDANRDLRGMDVYSLIGASDPNRNFITISAMSFLSQIQARNSGLQSIPGTGHNVLSTSAGVQAVNSLIKASIFP